MCAMCDAATEMSLHSSEYIARIKAHLLVAV